MGSGDSDGCGGGRGNEGRSTDGKNGDDDGAVGASGGGGNEGRSIDGNNGDDDGAVGASGCGSSCREGWLV